MLALIVSCCTLAAEAIAQDCDGRMNHHFLGDDIRQLEVSLSHLWILTYTGDILHSPMIGSEWESVKLEVLPLDTNGYSGHLWDISFFNRDTGIAVGGIGKDGLSYILRTTDGGKVWRYVAIGEGHMMHGLYTNDVIYNIWANKHGEAWIGGMAGRIYYTSSYGESWSIISHLYAQDERISVINMKDDGAGVIGSDRNGLQLTYDRGNTWTKVATPCDQIIKDQGQCENARIEGAIVFGGYLIVRQSGRCFYSSIDEISWKPLGNGVVKFEVLNSQWLVVIDSNLEIRILDSLLGATAHVLSKLDAHPVIVRSYGEHLFIVDAAGGLNRIGISSGYERLPFVSPELVTTGNMEIIKKYGNALFGLCATSIYRSENYGRTWCKWADVPCDISNLTVINDQRIICFCSGGDGAFEVLNGGSRLIADLQKLWIEDVVAEDNQIIVAAIKDSIMGDWPQEQLVVGSGVLYGSTDQGVSWMPFFEKENFYPRYIFAMAPNHIMVMGNNWDLYRVTTNESLTVAESVIMQDSSLWNKDGSVGQMSGLFFCDLLNGYISGYTSRGPYTAMTSDSGKSWRRTTDNLEDVLTVAKAESKTFLIGRSRVYTVDDKCALLMLVDVNHLKPDSGNELRIQQASVDDNGNLVIQVVEAGQSSRTDPAMYLWIYNSEQGKVEFLQ